MAKKTVKKPIKKKSSKRKTVKKKQPVKKGRPTKWEGVKTINTAYHVAELGGTDIKIAEALGISETTLNDWKELYPAFSASIKAGKAKADEKVQEALFKRASGYEFKETVKETGETFKTGAFTKNKILTRHAAPDVTAQIFWLKNRQPEIWRDRKHIDANIKVSEVDREKLSEAFDEFTAD